MSRTRAASLALCALLALTPACAPTPGGAAPDARPDLLLVVVDTLRADHVGFHGYARNTTPRLDPIARAGAIFDDTTAQSSWTLPSMASLLTGRRVFVNAERMPDGVPSLAERLAEAGYETAAFIGNPAISTKGGYDRGFHHFIGREVSNHVTWTARDLQGVLRRWRAEHPRDGRPRFLYLHFMDPHFPYEPVGRPLLPGEDPAVKLAQRLRLRDDTLAAWVAAVQAAPADAALRRGVDAEMRAILEQIDAYDREIANVDEVLAEILGELEPRPRLLVFASDHGEMLWERRHHDVLVQRLPPDERRLREVFFRDHSYHLSQALIHTPLMLAGPGFDVGRVLKEPVENIDIAPTLLRAAGLDEDPALDGRALQDVLAGTARGRPAIFSHCNEATAVRDVKSGWKFIFPTPTGDSYGMPMQLYRLQDDPHERRNRVDDEDEPTRAVLRGLLRLREEAAAADRLYAPGSHDVDDPEHDRVMRELGYVGGR